MVDQKGGLFPWNKKKYLPGFENRNKPEWQKAADRELLEEKGVQYSRGGKRRSKSRKTKRKNKKTRKTRRRRSKK